MNAHAQAASAEAARTEAAIRVDLAACYRLVALYGWDDLIFTHISARIPGPEHHFLINPYGMMFEEITASSLVKIGMDGQPVGRFALSRQSRRLHHPFGGARGARGRRLRHASAHARRHRGLDLEGGPAAAQPDRAARASPTSPITIMRASRWIWPSVRACSATSAAKNIMLLHNHGTLTVGRTCGEAFLRMYFLERACTMQVRTRMLGGDRDGPSDRARRDRKERRAGPLGRHVGARGKTGLAGVAAQAGSGESGYKN